jgi:hypothetical protein
MMLRISEIAEGVRLEVKVQPRSSRNQVVGEQNGVLKIKLTAPPVDGEANSALVAFLASSLKVPRQDISILRGETSRNKLVEINGISSGELMKKLGLKSSS